MDIFLLLYDLMYILDDFLLIFFISREVPIEIFETVISSCGGLYGDSSDTSAFTEDDKRNTQYIVYRPPNDINMKPNKEYVQPQWIFD